MCVIWLLFLLLLLSIFIFDSGELPIEELMKKYAYDGEEPMDVGTPSESEGSDEETDEEEDDEESEGKYLTICNQ